MKDQIDKDIENCRFLDIQVDEITDVSTKEQLSVIICLDRGGEIVERFLNLFDVSSDRSAVAISYVVRSILSRYGESLKEKLIMQTYDGASVMSGQIGGLQTLIHQEYPFAFFFHCAAHRLNLFLCQSASNRPSVKVFFANISAFSTFTSLSARRKDLFRSEGIEVPHPGDTRWYYHSRTINVIFNKYNTLLLILESIVDNPQSWDDGSLTQATGLLKYLNSFLFCFLPFVFSKIFEQSSIVFTVLQDRRIEFSYGASKIINFSRYLIDMCNDETFTEIYQSTVDLVEHPSSRSDRKHNYNDIYLQLLNCMVFMLSDRFSDIENFLNFWIWLTQIFSQCGRIKFHQLNLTS